MSIAYTQELLSTNLKASIYKSMQLNILKRLE